MIERPTRTIERSGLCLPLLLMCVIAMVVISNGCSGQGSSSASPTPTPTSTPLPATPSPTPTPVPTPEPVSIFGSIVIKLERGADVASGVPVMLLDRIELENAALRESQKLGDQLRARRNQIAAARERAARVEREIVAIVNQVADDACAAWQRARDLREKPGATTPRYLQIESSSKVSVFNSDIPISTNVGEAIEQFYYLRNVIPDAHAAARDNRKNDLRLTIEALEKEEELYESTYQFRPASADKSMKTIDKLKAEVEFNPYARLEDTTQELKDSMGHKFEQAEREIIEKNRQLDERLAPDIERSRTWIEVHLPRLQAEAFDRVVEEAEIDEFYADKDGNFRFEVPPGDYVLYSKYTDSVTGFTYVWLLPAKPGEQTISTYNTMSLETIDGMPMVQRLLYAPHLSATGDAPKPSNGPAPAVSGADW